MHLSHVSEARLGAPDFVVSRMNALSRGGVFGGSYQVGAGVEGFENGRFGFGKGSGLGKRVGKGCRDVEILGAADHLGGAGGVVGVVPDSNHNFQIRLRSGSMDLLLRSSIVLVIELLLGTPVICACAGIVLLRSARGVAETAEEAVGAGHSYGGHSGEEDDGGILFSDLRDGVVDSTHWEACGAESGEVEDLGEHVGNEVVCAVADGNDNSGASRDGATKGGVSGLRKGSGVS